MDNIFILSNNCISNSESNGRVHCNFVRDYIPGHIFNFYVRGIPDIDGVSYLKVSPKRALISKLTIGIIKPKIDKSLVKDSHDLVDKPNKKSRHSFFHLLRSFAYINNWRLLNELEKEVENNKITKIVLWGCNVPFLYNYAFKLSKHCKIALEIFTGEDYPLKKYNYLTNRKTLFFSLFQHQLYKEAKRAYLHSNENQYAVEELKDLYEKTFAISGGKVTLFRSNFGKIDHVSYGKVNEILYAGNLYSGRVDSLIDIAAHIQNIKDVRINVFGNISTSDLDRINKCKNIKYGGVKPFEFIINEIKRADLMLHLEGFDKDYIKDCKYAFSTKISDYCALGVPFFTYGPKEISGVNFLYNHIPSYVAINKDELSKLDNILNEVNNEQFEKLSILFRRTDEKN